MTRWTNRRTVLGAALASTTALLATACGAGDDPLAQETSSGPATSTSAVIVGSANFPESELLAEMYAQVLEGTGAQVERKFNIGNRELYLQGLQDGSIDLMPEYNGALLAALTDGDGGIPDDVKTSEQVYDALQDVLPDGLETLDQSAAEDKDTLSVTRATADRLKVASIADLAPVAGDLTCGAGPEFSERFQGLEGLKEVYGVEFGQFRSLDVGGPLTIGALTDGTIDVGNVLSTDSAIETNDFVVLDDPQNLFLVQNVLPIVRSAKSNAQIAAALNAFSAKLTTENLTAYLKRVQVDKQDTATVATAFLTDNGLA